MGVVSCVPWCGSLRRVSSSGAGTPLRRWWWPSDRDPQQQQHHCAEEGTRLPAVVRTTTRWVGPVVGSSVSLPCCRDDDEEEDGTATMCECGPGGDGSCGVVCCSKVRKKKGEVKHERTKKGIIFCMYMYMYMCLCSVCSSAVSHHNV